MSIRRSILLATVPAAMIAVPAVAQDGPPPPGAGDYGAALGPAYSGNDDGEFVPPAPPPAPGDDYSQDSDGYEQDAGADFANDRGYVPEQPDFGPVPEHAYRGDYHREGEHAYRGDYGALPRQAGPYQAAYPYQPAPRQLGYTAEQRDGWLHQCRARYGRDNDGGLGGAVIGGLAGGVIGNRVGGRHHRTEGTIIGAGVGALAGAAIDRAEDRGRARDECEDYLDRYEAYYAGGGASYGNGYAYGYGQNVIYVPMIVGWDCKPKRKTVEYIEEPAPARRVIYTKPAPKKVIYTKTKVIKTTKPTKYTK